MMHENTYRDSTIEIRPQESEVLSIIRYRGNLRCPYTLLLIELPGAPIPYYLIELPTPVVGPTASFPHCRLQPLF